MSLLKVKANKKVEKNENEAKGTQVAFLLSSEHVVFSSPMLCHISKSLLQRSEEQH